MNRRRLMKEVEQKEYVDLGLPSGLKWATGNIVKNGNTYSIGAETDYGCYFSWGNIDGHNPEEEYDFSDDTYDYTPGKNVRTNIASNDASHDAALACLGGGWHMPTKGNFVELFNKCDIIDANGTVKHAAGYTSGEIYGDMRTTYKGVKGLLLRSTINSNLLFFPCAGWCTGPWVDSVEDEFYYWTSSLTPYNSPYYMNLDPTYTEPQGYDNNKAAGRSVRGVIG